MNDWPGRRRAEASRQWPALEELAGRADGIEAIDGLLLLGSFARGNPDEVSDVDVLAVSGPGRFDEAWSERHRLAGNALVTWESGTEGVPLRWFKWLTRELVKFECGIVEPGARELAEPLVVLVGDASLAERFPRISIEELERRRRCLQAEQEAPQDPMQLPDGELIDWKLSELKAAVRRALR